ncbi:MULTISPECIES: glutamate-1-semialdehyde 2,1-aminomutase [Brucella/Ochrobactrum group]|jgi:glutamate-1-semialdehyde 2,1-aminomutase|uniref:Glutamate-1-semialdehyde 2,1-aminomutase n=1 Tax=Brucella pseudintermedia TaxID=370111 RepID=A0ABY5UH15_9HYPH|nr:MULTISPECIES: glutamate-1-semialdehyde 2,1-aminomutase [Brucella/Ochrobactrum group]KAB2681262.1 glutamate-1-semialdehyde 2,1-aminomutase [Brucella pseudintermedia]MCO7727958.1 glutamate-1-semialdehyde 2,1-aminomutase [Brucella intermedia]TWH04433.1 glutamate-1-semialdehyde 2,1-aminomutase [Ochrobactrum sp. J50]UWL62623.1 glutamate-1-semialdehyde 2,1-aminomutase [Brucella pseudintermedia]WPM81752.1 glutamate-1-semialdehyde 2,1-aminomutase [Brucella pseudintermedia]
MNLFTSQFRNSQLLASKAHALIPGGCHTYAKGDDQYPVLAPGFIQRGSGSHVFDVDGHEYIEYGMGNRAVGLGHAYPPVVRAVRDALQDGCNFTRPSAIEVECAECFLELIDSADMVKFCKDGSDATSGAVRLARAYTGRDMVACCADHPFFSTDDWFIGTTKMNAGIPASVSALTATFRYNDIASVQALFDDYPGRIAAIILEPAKADEPQDNFLREARRIAHENGALFILDEMITGFRWHLRGAQKLYDVEPDLSCFGKALGNGFAISALAGKAEYMQLGGLTQTDHPRVFLLSTTHGAETHAMAAAIATMTIYRDEPVIERLYEQGSKLAEGVNAAIAAHGLQNHVRLFGRPCCLAYGTLDEEGQPSQAFRTLFLQETIRRGVLMPSLVVSYTHSDTDIARTVDAIDGALGIYVRALNDGVGSYLTGRPSQVVYRRFNEAPTYPSAMR